MLLSIENMQNNGKEISVYIIGMAERGNLVENENCKLKNDSKKSLESNYYSCLLQN